jgi:hypothetical protein
MSLIRIAAATATLAISTTLSAQVVTNSSFEAFTSIFSGNGDAVLLAGSTQLTGWTVVGGESALLRNGNVYGLTSRSGANFLDLAGFTDRGFPKGISQSVTGLTVGQTYTFSMWLGTFNGPCAQVGFNRCSGPIEARATVGASSQTFTHNPTAAGNQWGNYTFNFAASSSTMLLLIEGISLPSGNAYIGLDDVSIVAATTPPPMGTVPEPRTYALMVAGLGVVSLLARRRRQQ